MELFKMCWKKLQRKSVMLPMLTKKGGLGVTEDGKICL